LQSRRPSPSIAVHHRPSPRRPSPPSRHRAVFIRPSPLQSQSIAIALVLSQRTSPSKSRRAIHCRQGAVAPSIAVAPRRPSPSRSRPSLSIRLLLSSRRCSVHCCPSLLSCRRAVHRRCTAPSNTVKSPSRRPLPSIAVAITVHHHSPPIAVESQLFRSLLSSPSSRCCPPSITGQCLSPLRCQSLSLIRLVVAFPLVTPTPPVHRLRSFRTACCSTFF